MSFPTPTPTNAIVLSLLTAAARRGRIVGVVLVGVMSAAGCGGSPKPAAAAPAVPPTSMQSAANVPPDVTLLEDTDGLAARRSQAATGRPTSRPPAVDPAGSAAERKRAQRADIEAVLDESMTPPPALPTRPGRVLDASDRAVAPLADTVAAIDAAQQVVVENLRNIETSGFKVARTAVGHGRDVARQLDVTQGELQATERALDVAVRGDGFFQVQVYTPESPDGAIGITRNGRLYMNRTGELVVGEADGFKLIPPITLPTGTTGVTISKAGNVAAVRAGSDEASPVAAGRIHLVRFTDPTVLRPLGGGIYAETDASGPAVESPAGERGAGTVVQGFLELSNADLLRERMRMRFLQGWRMAIFAALDGAPAGAEPPAVSTRRPARVTAGSAAD